MGVANTKFLGLASSAKVNSSQNPAQAASNKPDKVVEVKGARP